MTSASATKTTRPPRPLSGWVLDKLLMLDAAHPGILRFAHQASPLRRQVIYLTLAHLFFTSPEDVAAHLRCNSNSSPPSDPLRDIGTALMTQRVRDIIKAFHPDVEGLLGVLHRLGDTALNPVGYRALVRVLSDPDQRRARVLRQTPRITETTHAVMRIIDPALLFPDLLRHIRTTKDAQAFTATVDLIRRVVPDVTDTALVASLKALGPTSRLDGWAQRWLARSEFPLLASIQDDEDWRVLRSGRGMQEAAARFHNCLRDKVAVCALGRAAYIEWLADPAIIELTAVSGSGGQVAHVVEGIHGIRNSRVAPTVVHAICAKATHAGLLLPAKLGHARRYNRAARILNVFEFGGIQGLPYDDVVEVETFIDEIMNERAA